MVRIPARCPCAKALAERFVRTLRAELTDRMLIFSQRHLRVVLAEYIRHYNGQRPHRARNLRPPQPTHFVADPTYERIKRRPILSGLIQRVRTGSVKLLLNIGGRLMEPHRFDHERFAIYVWRSVRAHGDTKTEKSRRTLELPMQAAQALRTHHVRQARQRLAAGTRWRDHGLVFASQAGTPLDGSHVRRAFKVITKEAWLGENWTPRELRHSFVSLMSDNGVPLETIADLVGHASTAVTEAPTGTNSSQ